MYKEIAVVPVERVRNSLYWDGAEMFIDIADDCITLEVSPDIPEDDIEILLEHEICHCADFQEEVYGREVFSAGKAFVQGLALEMDMAHSDYFASRRQIALFRPERFRRYQLRGLHDFVKKVDSYIRELPEPDDKILALYSLFKEQVKCSLIDTDLVIIPPVIAAVCRPLPEIFDLLRKEHQPWPVTTQVLYVVAASIATNIDLLCSYNSGRVVAASPRHHLSEYLCDQNIIGSVAWGLGNDAENILFRYYPLSDAFTIR